MFRRSVFVGDVLCVYVSVFLFGFFLVDASGSIDVAGETFSNSASFALFGRGFEDIAGGLEAVFFVLAVVFMCATLAVLLYKKLRKPLSKMV